ncbi:MAG: FG-GAP repeat domain-containing protein, partial [Limisphaerales bacterium]
VFDGGEVKSERVVKNTELTLAEKERKLIWEFEHRGNILNQFALKDLQAAIASRDMDAVQKHLSVDFDARVPVLNANGTVASRQLNEASAVRWDSQAGNNRLLAVREFLPWLKSELRPFAGKLKVKFSLISFQPQVRENISGEWIGKVRARLAGEGSDGAPAETMWFMDLWVAQPDKEKLKQGSWLNALTITRTKIARAGKYLMTDVAEEQGIDVDSLYDTWTTELSKDQANPAGVYVCDFNRDGYVDMLVAEINIAGKEVKGTRLYRGSKEGFVDAGESLGLQLPDVYTAAFIDIDGDGWEDLVLNEGLVFRNVDGKRFEEVSAQSNLGEVGGLVSNGNISQFAIADYDRDGRVDIYVFRVEGTPKSGSWIEGHTTDRSRNRLLRNVGSWKFEDVTVATGTDGGLRSTFSTVWFDANNDNWPDMYVIHEFGTGVLLLNQEGKKFESRKLFEGISTFGAMGMTVGDMNNDNNVDLYVGKMYSKAGQRVIGNLLDDAYDDEVMQKLHRMVGGSELFSNLGGLKFEAHGDDYDISAVGWAYAPAVVDLDNDGFLDLHATTGFISRTRQRPDG